MFSREWWKKRSLRVRDDKVTKAAELSLRESILPICLVTILFFLWGFSYGLLDTLNKHFQETLHITKSRSAGLQAAYFGAYPLASLGHAAWILRRFSYRAVFIWGLFLYGLGALLAIPCIKAHSFAGFCVCIFIIGNGLGSLETAANPYITVCGPPRYSEIRINVAQAFNGIGTVVAPVLGSYVFFVFDEEVALQNVQWVYTAIAIFVFFLAVVFYLIELPEITDADMQHQAAETHAGEADQPFRKQYRLFHASFAQFCYTGAQIAIAGYFINYVTETRKGTDSALGARFLAGAQGSFAIGRFVGAAVMHFVRPRKVFLIFLTACIIFVAPSITQRENTGMSMLYVTLFFESICFPTIMALGMRGLGRHTKRGSGFLVAGVFGGAVVPPLMGAVADMHDTAMSMVVPLAFFVVAWSYALAVNFWPWYRDTCDAFTTADIGVREREDGVVGSGKAAVDEEEAVAMERQTVGEKGL
ncbi:major facilitator superfamily domain-containing protein [Pseudoneurospora amorphoporcata]|uniref:Major facilitator superfamily domain-containing protein n=1 Tax=Pseudoneurospora amorphoporcata TaxID=241081 RepID=A0AAN6NSP7_9PEZI|nr:major facilitator superfamily domain-containing protein [Pseudoneurospora amorphoporcata]